MIITKMTLDNIEKRSSRKKVFRIFIRDKYDYGRIDSIGFDNKNFYRTCYYGNLFTKSLFPFEMGLKVKDFYSIKIPIDKYESDENIQVVSAITGGVFYNEDNENTVRSFVDLKFKEVNYYDGDIIMGRNIPEIKFDHRKSKNKKLIGGGANLDIYLESLNDILGDDYLNIVGPLLQGMNLFATSAPFKLYFYMNNKRNTIDFQHLSSISSIGNRVLEAISKEDLRRMVNLLACGCYPNFKRNADKNKLDVSIFGYIGYTEAIIKIKVANKGESRININLSDHFRLMRIINWFEHPFIDDNEFYDVADKLGYEALYFHSLFGCSDNHEFISDWRTKFFNVKLNYNRDESKNYSYLDTKIHC